MTADLGAPSASPSGNSPGHGEAREFVSFRLAGQDYGIDNLKVQEIRGYETPTRLANVPAFIKGVLNLRGVIVPIIDLRLRFKLEPGEPGVVIILKAAARVVGVVVDAVGEVALFAPQPLASGACANACGCVIGLGAGEGRGLILLDIERVLANGDLALIEAAPLQ